MPPAFGDPISTGTLHAFQITANQIVALRIGAATLHAHHCRVNRAKTAFEFAGNPWINVSPART